MVGNDVNVACAKVCQKVFERVGWEGLSGWDNDVFVKLEVLFCCSFVSVSPFFVRSRWIKILILFSVPLLDDTLNFVVQTCLISDRRWVDWGLIGHARGHVFRCWLQFCRGRNTNRVLTSALLVLSRRLLRSRAMPNGTVQPPSASQDGVT